ncbi:MULTISPECIES: hypothetical protein [unclassified Rhodococcus (in: high G+C Gram-positive bacteria)]|uniref:hypothetical protein n=1 Tax=unclassified Rhodococcus (in: high G+C Gram-positive bacteria) TaxID=192944 RepID=UPI000A9E88FD|nr:MULTISPECIES: hypothetical protein [unclassified Rhodococcus (in: high G+C Gram-positive bacteria)]
MSLGSHPLRRRPQVRMVLQSNMRVSPSPDELPTLDPSEKWQVVSGRSIVGYAQ